MFLVIVVRFNKDRTLMVIEAKDQRRKRQIQNFALRLVDKEHADAIEDNVDYLCSKIRINKNLEICAEYFQELPYREMKDFKEGK